MIETKKIHFSPYARLLTMLGDQLIKNERIALVELIKNAYDADASWVKITFMGFGPEYEVKPASKIVVEDDGTGMTQAIIEEDWVSPATPVKKIGKETQESTPRGRIVQGEKGIGRFAILKLGKEVSITTRPDGSSDEYTLTMDFSRYDDEFLKENEKPKKLFLQDLDIELSVADQATQICPVPTPMGRRKFRRAPHGTRIEITSLKGTWSKEKVDGVYDDVVRLQSIFDESPARTRSGGGEGQSDFEVLIYKDSEYQDYSNRYLEKLHVLIEDHSVFRIEKGEYDEAAGEFRFLLNGRERKLHLGDPEITGLRVFRDYFARDGEAIATRSTKCGPFAFGFYVFDLSNRATGKYALDSEDRDLIKQHRIYLYRDGIRVYPYGDPDDDWLQIDVSRGKIGAGWFLSNDQVVGFVNITQKRNPELKDKTSREGLIDTGDPHYDFLHLIQVFLAWVRKKPYDRYRRKLEGKRGLRIVQEEGVMAALHALEQRIGENKPALESLARVSKLYKQERSYLIHRAEDTEQLAGVGLSVETASHDIMMVMGKTLATIDALIRETQRPGDLDKDLINRDLSTLRGMLSFIETQLKDIQLLFKSTKQRRTQIRVREILDKVHRLFIPTLAKDKVNFHVSEKGPPLIARTTDAVLLQLFLNLFDNSVYWLRSSPRPERRIECLLDGDEGVLVFSDNGPGVDPDDAPYIFEPFYSGKGEEGRGLGLYIARQLLDRHDYSIELADLRRHKRLPGANFVVSFVQHDDNA
jgi:signal transduction histidine kinase